MRRDAVIRNGMLAGLLPFLLLIPVPPGAAQQPSLGGVPVFRAGAKLVEVTVTVRDKKGQAVITLAASDFTVQDDGKTRPVAFFRFDGGPDVPAPPAQQNRPEAGVFTNRGEPSGAARSSADAPNAPFNVTALVLDSVNTTPQGGIMARAQMMRYLKELAPRTCIGIFQMKDELRILHDFSDDATALRAKLAEAMLAVPLRESTNFNRLVVESTQFASMFADSGVRQADADLRHMIITAHAVANAVSRRDRMERSLAAMEALGLRLAGIPGRKNIVWISSGFSMVSVQGRLGAGAASGGFESYEEQLRQTARQLAQEGVVLYIVNPEGLTPLRESTAANAPKRPGAPRDARFEEAERVSTDPNSAMEMMAAVTGGRYMHDTNDLASGFQQAGADLRGSYTLGFYAPEEPDDKWHKLKVRVNRPGLNLRHREGYMSETATRPVEWNDSMWQTALSNPLGSSAVPLTAKREKTAVGELILSVVADLNSLDFRTEGENLRADLKVAIAENRAGGTSPPYFRVLIANVPAAKWEAARSEGVAFRQQWAPSADATAIRLVVVDLHTGRYGSLDVPLPK